MGSGYTQVLFIVKNQNFFKFKYTYLSPLISKISRIIQTKYHKIAVLLPHHATFSNYIYLSVCMYVYIYIYTHTQNSKSTQHNPSINITIHRIHLTHIYVEQNLRQGSRF